MGNSEDGGGGGISDTSVGTIVWVRRRNGSWWPGRILGSDELSASHLMSPRSGTPVKLLGREDASVDWYNLEKSKRVKAFRCREFDACIEKAEASQGIPIKKREKYARREDAIVHALELERKQLEAKQLNSGFSTNDVTNKYLGSLRRDFKNVSGSDIYSRNNEPGMHSKFSVHKSQSFVEKLALLHEDMDNPSYVHMAKNDKHIEWEEDIPEAIHRMRGLQDFHIGSKKKLSQFVSWDPRKPAGNNLDLPSTGQLLGGINHACSGRSTLEVKRKRSRGALVEESIAKKWDRRRPLVQVLRCSAKLSVSHLSQPDHDPYAIPMQGENEQMIVCQSKRSKCIYLPTDRSDSLGHGGNPSEEALIPGKQFVTDNCMDLPGSLTEEYTSSGLIGKNELDSSGKEYFETVTEEADLLRDAAQFSSGSKRCNAAAFEVSEKLRDMNNKEVPLPKYAPQLHLYDHTADASAEVGVSMWHMKGKRNIRNLARRPTALMDEKISITNSGQCDECPREMTYGTKGCNFVRAETELSSQRTEQHGFYHDKEVSYASGKLDLICEDFGQGQTGYGDRRYSSILKAARGHRRTRIHFSDLENESHMISVSGWEADGPSYASQKSYWKESDECYDSVYAAHIRKERRPMLVDVDLTVQASYQREHVPLVSLRSRLNGKAIVGHPLQTEILEDGSTDQYFSGDCAGSDESLAPQPAWRTARRTAVQRVPRSNTVTSALEGEDTGVLCPDQDRKPPLKSGYFNHQVRLANKNILHAPRQAGMSQKPLKNVSLPSKKTRRFSSIGTKQKLGGENGELKLINSSDILGGLIEPDGAVPMVTCVPVKIAFSRILEAVGRPSAAAHRARMISAAVRDPS